MRGALGHGRIETVAALFDGRKMEACGVGYALQEIGIAGVGIGSGDCGVMAFVEVGDGLRKDEARIEVRIVGAAAVPRPPTGVQGKLHEVGQAKLSTRAGGLAAGQGAEWLEIYRAGA